MQLYNMHGWDCSSVLIREVPLVQSVLSTCRGAYTCARPSYICSSTDANFKVTGMREKFV